MASASSSVVEQLLREILSEVKQINENLMNISQQSQGGEKPKRSGSNWTDEEEKQFISEIEEKKSIDEIATLHQRTKASIKYRQIFMASELSRSGMNMEDICHKTGLNAGGVKHAIARYVSFTRKGNIRRRAVKSEVLSEAKSEVIKSPHDNYVIKGDGGKNYIIDTKGNVVTGIEDPKTGKSVKLESEDITYCRAINLKIQ
jgi:hypothetical protein